MDIYREKLLDHYNDPRNFGELADADAGAQLENISCGDSIAMQLRSNGKVLEDVKFTGEGCAVAIASASILTEYVKGKSLEEIMELDIEKLQTLLGVQLTLSRIKCAALSLETLKKGTAKIIAKSAI